MSTDLSTWLSKPEAAARLGISERTLERMVLAGTGPEQRNRPRPGKRPEAVFNPEDVQTFAQAPAVIAAASPLMPKGVPPSAGHGQEIPPALAALMSVFERMLEMAQRPRLDAPQETSALWLNLAQARAYSGLSIALLRRLIDSGRLPAIQDGAIKVRRNDLDNIDNVAELAALRKATNELRTNLKSRRERGAA
jgi:hypothetical protein